MTAFYRQERGLISTPILRAKAFQYLMNHKTIYIHPDELIVGEDVGHQTPCLHAANGDRAVPLRLGQETFGEQRGQCAIVEVVTILKAF